MMWRRKCRLLPQKKLVFVLAQNRHACLKIQSKSDDWQSLVVSHIPSLQVFYFQLEFCEGLVLNVADPSSCKIFRDADQSAKVVVVGSCVSLIYLSDSPPYLTRVNQEASVPADNACITALLLIWRTGQRQFNAQSAGWSKRIPVDVIIDS